MGYVVKALKQATMPMRVGEEIVGPNWAKNAINVIDDALYNRYKNQTSVFTILGKSNGTPAGLAVVSGLTAVDICNDGLLHQTVFMLSDVAQAVVNGTEYQGTKLFDFPAGRINVLGCVASLAQKTTSALASTLNASSVGAVSIGSATASNVSLTGTMVNLLPSTAFTSSATVNVAGAVVTNALAAGAQLDGTSTPIALYLNSAFATTTDVDADATQTWSGTITVSWMNLGDY